VVLAIYKRFRVASKNSFPSKFRSWIFYGRKQRRDKFVCARWPREFARDAWPGMRRNSAFATGVLLTSWSTLGNLNAGVAEENGRSSVWNLRANVRNAETLVAHDLWSPIPKREFEITAHFFHLTPWKSPIASIETAFWFVDREVHRNSTTIFAFSQTWRKIDLEASDRD